MEGSTSQGVVCTTEAMVPGTPTRGLPPPSRRRGPSLTGPTLASGDGGLMKGATMGGGVVPGPSEGSDGRGAAPEEGPAETTGVSLQDRRLRDVGSSQGAMRVTARVLTAERREIARKDGVGKLAVLSGLLSDGTATMRFSWWDPPSVDLERGSVLRVTNPQVRTWRDRPELSFGWKTQVEFASELELPRLEDSELLERHLSELRPGEEGFRVLAKVLLSESRTLTVGERKRVIRSGLLGDSSGRMAFTAWVDLDLPVDSVVEIFGASARPFQGELQVVMDERSRVERRPEVELLSMGGLATERPVEIGWLEERPEGPGRRAIEGVVVELRSPSGLIHRCPHCSRSLVKGFCREHGPSRGEPDLRARLVLDDGTGSVTAQLSRECVENLLGLDLPKAIELARERLDPTAVQELLSERVLTHRLRLLGRAVPGLWGLTFFVDRVLPLTPEATVVEEANCLLRTPDASLREGP